MSLPAFAPPAVAPAEVLDLLRTQGYAVLDPRGVAEWLDLPLDALETLRSDWDDLPADAYLKDGGRYRQRRHACFTVDGDTVAQVAQRAHWQPVEYNALHGGMHRWFAPMKAESVASPVWQRLLGRIAEVASGLYGDQRWFVEAHQFRIDTAGGIGRPTPEGAHRDGVDLVAVMLVAREGIRGGETRVFEAHGPRGERFTLTAPWSLLLLDDARVIHESTPIQPLSDRDGRLMAGGHRDTLVATCRRGGFQGDVQAG